jgi:hypothetical protein
LWFPSLLKMMINGRFITIVPFSFLLLVAYTSLLGRAYDLHSKAHLSVSSHSGPTNALYGHEVFHDEPLSAEQRQKRNAMWGNNYVYQNNGWPNLLASSEPPSGHMTGWISNEHNRYRRMVSYLLFLSLKIHYYRFPLLICE